MGMPLLKHWFLTGAVLVVFSGCDKDDNEIPGIHHKPVVDAGESQCIILPNNSIVLNGSGSDADGTITSYHWRKASGPETYRILNVSTARTEVQGLGEGRYEFELKATDNDGLTATDRVVINVLPSGSNTDDCSGAGDWDY